MGAQVFASEAVTCPVLLLSCLAGLQLPLACLLLIINSVLLYATYLYSLRVCSARTVVPGRAPHSHPHPHPHQLAVVEVDSCGAAVLQRASPVTGGLGGAPQHRRKQRQRQRPATASAGGAHRKLGCFSRSAAQCSAVQHSTAPPLGQHKSAVLGSVAFAAQRSTASCVQLLVLPPSRRSLIPALALAQPRAGALKTAPRPGVH
jgi:hypothetical protein